MQLPLSINAIILSIIFLVIAILNLVASIRIVKTKRIANSTRHTVWAENVSYEQAVRYRESFIIGCYIWLFLSILLMALAISEFPN